MGSRDPNGLSAFDWLYLAAMLAVLIVGGRMLYRLSIDVHDIAEYSRFQMARETASRTSTFDPDKYLRDLAAERAAAAR